NRRGTPRRSPTGPPPRTRGDQPGLVEVDDGTPDLLPAHAGINPSTNASPGTPCPPPRTRGDQPGQRLIAGLDSSSSPHTRGSTDCVRDAEQHDHLLPAHAGINRAADAVQNGATAPPRVRGHQPSKAVREKLRDATSPHTHAGINPGPLFRPPPAPPPPRIRGDKPNCWETRRQVMDTFPHTRGST